MFQISRIMITVMTNPIPQSVTPYNLCPNFYLLVDKEGLVTKEKGFGVLTRARVEGEKYELREVASEQVQDLLQLLPLR